MSIMNVIIIPPLPPLLFFIILKMKLMVMIFNMIENAETNRRS